MKILGQSIGAVRGDSILALLDNIAAMSDTISQNFPKKGSKNLTNFSSMGLTVPAICSSIGCCHMGGFVVRTKMNSRF